MKAAVDLTAGLAGLGWSRRSKSRTPTGQGAFLFSIVSTNRQAAEGGRQIDGGSVPLHPSFMSLHDFMVRQGRSRQIALLDGDDDERGVVLGGADGPRRLRVGEDRRQRVGGGGAVGANQVDEAIVAKFIAVG